MPVTANDFIIWFLNVFFKRKYLAVFIFAAVIGLAYAVTFLLAPVYMASSQILVKIGRENIYMPARGDANPIIGSSSMEQINSEVELLRNQNLHENVVKTIGPQNIYPDLVEDKPEFLEKLSKLLNRREKLLVMEEALLNFQKALKVQGIKNSRIVLIGFKHPDPAMAADIVDKLVDTYLNHRLNVHDDKRSYDFFREQTEILKKKIRKGEEELKFYKQKHNVHSLSEERSLLLKQKSDQITQLNQTQNQKIEVQKKIHQLSIQMKKIPKTISQGEVIERNPLLINTLEARLIELELDEKELLSKYTEQSRLVLEVREEIKTINNKLVKHETKKHIKSSFGPNPTHQRFRGNLLNYSVELQAVSAKADEQIVQLGICEERLENLNKVENRFREIENQLDIDRDNYRLYLTKFEESRISSEMDNKKIANVSIIKRAKPPIKPVSPNVLLNIAVGFGLALALSLLFPMMLEFMQDKIERPEDVEQILNVPVLASIPKLRRP